MSEYEVTVKTHADQHARKTNNSRMGKLNKWSNYSPSGPMEKWVDCQVDL